MPSRMHIALPPTDTAYEHKLPARTYLPLQTAQASLERWLLLCLQCLTVVACSLRSTSAVQPC